MAQQPASLALAGSTGGLASLLLRWALNSATARWDTPVPPPITPFQRDDFELNSDPVVTVADLAWHLFAYAAEMCSCSDVPVWLEGHLTINSVTICSFSTHFEVLLAHRVQAYNASWL